MTLQPTRGEEIAAACAELRARGPFPQSVARGLAADNPDEMRAAVKHLVDAGRLEGLRELVERFRARSDFGVWARVTSAQLHRAAGEFAAGLADIDDLMQRFPARAGAHWWVARGHCLEGLGRGDQAAAAAREGVARFADAALPRVYLGNLLLRLKRPEEALQVWRDLHARLPEPEPEWFLGLANALKALGRRDEAVEALESGARRFPGDPAASQLLAEAAEERNHWERALEIWQDYARRFPEHEARAARGRARALFRLDRVEAAVEALEALLARQPDDIAALRERASVAMQLGDAERAKALFTLLTQRFTKQSRPEWWASLAHALHDLREFEAGEAALAELERRFPESSLADVERLRLDHWLERGQDDLIQRVERALERHPRDHNLRAEWVQLLLGQGRFDLAEPVVLSLEAEKAPERALVSRLRLEADRGGDAHVRTCAQALTQDRDWTFADAVDVANFLLNHRTPWSIDLGCAILDGVADRFGRNIGLTVTRARLKIRRRDDEAALALIDAIPPQYQGSDVLELRAWAQVKRGDLEAAKRLWRRNLSKVFFAAIDGPMHTLERLSKPGPPPADGKVSAYVVYRNEAPQLPGFLAHHRRIGVRRFVFFDHMSNDESCELLLNEPDVVLYRSRDSYQLSSSGRRWVKDVIAREGARGWGLQIDPDEYFFYPGCETTPIDRLVAYLQGRGYEAVRGYMLDVFARHLLDPDGEPTPLCEHRFYDDDYVWIGQERPPFLSPVGGVRTRLFGAAEYLHKTPLWRLDAGDLLNSHETTPLALADVTGALIHYKLSNMALRGRHLASELGALPYLEADAPTEVMRRHSRYVARLSALWRADLVAPGVSRELADSLTLAGRGLMDMSEDYRRFLRAV